MTRRDALSGPDGTQALPPLRVHPDALTTTRAVPPARTRSVAPRPPVPRLVADQVEPFSLPPARTQHQPAQPQSAGKAKGTSSAAKIGCFVMLALPLLAVVFAALFG
ncbi:hypothetical protein ABT324_04235 [Saccharopolyspora sp. NPDC000359]|uniref:hypothetical protein n=1 Tax=Saccharopolyspora sp. NPDC000359 TaxID=3154251 RepID=UPI00332C3023